MSGSIHVDKASKTATQHPKLDTCYTGAEEAMYGVTGAVERDIDELFEDSGSENGGDDDERRRAVTGVSRSGRMRHHHEYVSKVQGIWSSFTTPHPLCQGRRGSKFSSDTQKPQLRKQSGIFCK